ncbi:MAG: hypothetical protein K0U74_10260 [Alphaproteobacteria bacterium]|nr:hypothetical protein [Alphaproteobacteria bacterium]
MTHADIEACKAQDEENFRKAVAEVTTFSLQKSLENVDYKALVDDEWRKQDVGAVLDARVDIAVKEVREEKSWGNLLKTLAYRAEAQKLATEIAERVYRSDSVTKSIEGLASGVGDQIGRRIEFAAQDAAQPALQCLQAYLGPRYGSTVANLVREDARRDFMMSSEEGSAQVTPGTVLKNTGGGATGLAILIVRRQLANLARTVGQRIVGSVLARLVSVVAGGVGLVLIAKDIWDFRHGVLPIIENEMKSEATKEKVREVLAETIATQIKSHIEQIGASSANRVVEVWREFRSAHLKALELADSNEQFRSFLDSIGPDRLGRLDEVVGLILTNEGNSGIIKRLGDGTLNEAVTKLPEPALQIARTTRSLEQALKWNAIAGVNTAAVVEYGVYREAQPDTFTQNSLRQLLALEDRVAILRLAGLSPTARTTLFDLETNALRGLARSLNKDELSQLTGYLTGLQQAPREQVLRAVAQSPAKLKLLAKSRVRDAVLTSPDQSAAVDMMLRADNGFSPKTTLRDVQLVLDGRVNPVLLVDKHPIALGAALFTVLLLLFMLRRLFYSPRKREVTTTSS